HCKPGGRMNGGSEKKPNANTLYTTGDRARCKINAPAKLLQDIRRTAARADRAVAVLRHANSCARNYECRNSGDVECPTAVAAGSTGIDESLVRSWMVWSENRGGVAPHRLCKTHNFIQCLGLRLKALKETDNMRVCGAPGEDLLHGCLSFGTRQIRFRVDFYNRPMQHSFC